MNVPEDSELLRMVGRDRAAELRERAAERLNAGRTAQLDADALAAAIRAPRLRRPLRPVTLTLTPQARQIIHTDLWQRANSHAETGGPVHGSIADTHINVTHAGVWPDDATRERDHLVYRLGDTADDETLIGTWHSHRSTAGTTPSTEDLASAGEHLADFEQSRVVIIIAAYDGHAALARGIYTLGAYLVQRDAAGRVTYETVAIR